MSRVVTGTASERDRGTGQGITRSRDGSMSAPQLQVRKSPDRGKPTRLPADTRSQSSHIDTFSFSSGTPHLRVRVHESNEKQQKGAKSKGRAQRQQQYGFKDSSPERQRATRKPEISRDSPAPPASAKRKRQQGDDSAQQKEEAGRGGVRRGRKKGTMVAGRREEGGTVSPPLLHAVPEEQEEEDPWVRHLREEARSPHYPRFRIDRSVQDAWFPRREVSLYELMGMVGRRPLPSGTPQHATIHRRHIADSLCSPFAPVRPTTRHTSARSPFPQPPPLPGTSAARLTYATRETHTSSHAHTHAHARAYNALRPHAETHSALYARAQGNPSSRQQPPLPPFSPSPPPPLVPPSPHGLVYHVAARHAYGAPSTPDVPTSVGPVVGVEDHAEVFHDRMKGHSGSEAEVEACSHRSDDGHGAGEEDVTVRDGGVEEEEEEGREGRSEWDEFAEEEDEGGAHDAVYHGGSGEGEAEGGRSESASRLSGYSTPPVAVQKHLQSPPTVPRPPHPDHANTQDADVHMEWVGGDMPTQPDDQSAERSGVQGEGDEGPLSPPPSPVNGADQPKYMHTHPHSPTQRRRLSSPRATPVYDGSGVHEQPYRDSHHHHHHHQQQTKGRAGVPTPGSDGGPGEHQLKRAKLAQLQQGRYIASGVQQQQQQPTHSLSAQHEDGRTADMGQQDARSRVVGISHAIPAAHGNKELPIYAECEDRTIRMLSSEEARRALGVDNYATELERLLAKNIHELLKVKAAQASPWSSSSSFVSCQQSPAADKAVALNQQRDKGTDTEDWPRVEAVLEGVGGAYGTPVASAAAPGRTTDVNRADLSRRFAADALTPTLEYESVFPDR